MTRVSLATASAPGAVAILLLHGPGVVDVLKALTGRDAFASRRAHLCRFAQIDEGLAVLLSDQAAQLMPHGGPRVVQKLVAHLTTTLGCIYDPAPDTKTLYPEAGSLIEADMLNAIALAASPAAIDLLADQPMLWADQLKLARLSPESICMIRDRSRILDRLIHPPTVVVVGPPNAGKSTLTNAMMGQAVSLVADLPGTTRDWVGGLVELGFGGWELGQDQQGTPTDRPNPQTLNPNTHIAVHWLDTPGLRDSDDRVEQRAIALAREQIARAQVLIAMRDPAQNWPEVKTLPREPDLYVINKVDDAPSPDEHAGRSPEHPLPISAASDRNLDHLQRRIIEHLGLSDLKHEPWAFSDSLRSFCATGDGAMLDRYLADDTHRV